MLHLLEENEAETDERREARLGEELAEHLQAHAGSKPSWKSLLYMRLQKARLLHLLEENEAETDEQREARSLTRDGTAPIHPPRCATSHKLDLNKKMPTLLHSQGSLTTACPCGWRTSGLSPQRLTTRGVSGVIIQGATGWSSRAPLSPKAYSRPSPPRL